MSGRFTGKVGDGKASQYGMASTAFDAQVELWGFSVREGLKGAPASTLVIARFNQTETVSGEPAVKPGLRATLFLSKDASGARVVIGGNQGFLFEGEGGSLTPSDTSVPLKDATSVSALKQILA